MCWKEPLEVQSPPQSVANVKVHQAGWSLEQTEPAQVRNKEENVSMAALQLGPRKTRAGTVVAANPERVPFPSPRAGITTGSWGGTWLGMRVREDLGCLQVPV